MHQDQSCQGSLMKTLVISKNPPKSTNVTQDTCTRISQDNTGTISMPSSDVASQASSFKSQNVVTGIMNTPQQDISVATRGGYFSKYNFMVLKDHSRMLSLIVVETTPTDCFRWSIDDTRALAMAVNRAQGSEGSRKVKDKKFWISVATELNETKAVSVVVSHHQCKWKYNKMVQLYNKEKNWDSLSWHDPYAECFNDSLPEDVFYLIANTRGHREKYPPEVRASLPKSALKKSNGVEGVENNAGSSLSGSQTDEPNLPRVDERRERIQPSVRKTHGSGSRFNRAKLDLLQRFSRHPETMSVMSKEKISLLEESIKIKRQHFEAFKKHLEMEEMRELRREEYEERKIREKNRRHKERMELKRERNLIEKERNRLLDKMLLANKCNL